MYFELYNSSDLNFHFPKLHAFDQIKLRSNLAAPAGMQRLYLGLTLLIWW